MKQTSLSSVGRSLLLTACVIVGSTATRTSAADPQPVTLSIKRAVTLSFQSQTNEQYLVYRSSDLQTWNPYGAVINGNGQFFTLTYVTEGSDHSSFRIQTTTGQVVEIKKTISDFKDYLNWRLLRAISGPNPALGGGAHSGDTNYFRLVYVQPAEARPIGGQYPVGTIFVKELRENDNGKPGNVTGAITVMVKRGGTFSPEGNGWEYFMTDLAFTQTLAQGGSETMCFSCHNSVKDRDFVWEDLP